MASVNSVWCFLVPLLLVLGTVVTTSFAFSDDFEAAEFVQQENSEIEVRCPPKERYDRCLAHCQKNCSNINENPGICPGICQPGCVCIPGLVRGPNGRCIPPRECPAKVVCPFGEHFDECDYACQRNCTNWDEPVIICPKMCVPGCICDKGTVRSSLPSGRCIKPEKCPPKDEGDSWDNEEENSEEEDDSEESRDDGRRSGFCPRHEEFIACKAICELNCKNRNATEVPCPGFCVSGCRCVSGYVRGPKGTCIKPDKCPADDTTIYPVKRVCPRREVWNPYVAHCQGNCSTDGKLIPCVRMGVAGCICKDELTRRDDGKCVPLRKCPKKEEMSVGESFCPSNEEFVKCNALWEDDCGKSPLFKKYCVSGCRCVSGYVRGPKGTCIKKEECPSDDTTRYPVKRVCPENEVWSGAAHCQKNCTHPLPRPCPRILIGGCVCRDGLYRRPDGKCVPKRLCFKEEEISSEDFPPIDLPRKLIDDGSAKFCPPNEEFVKCKALWEEDCGNTPKRGGFCVSGCRCESGYVRGPKGTCIKKEECPSNDTTRYPVKRVCPRNEHWSSVAHCQKNCTHPQEPPCPKIAVYGCVCDEGLYRRPDGKCVPLKRCFKVEEAGESFCPANEVFVACRSHCEKNCGNKNESVLPCPRLCVSGCRCIWGYVRGPEGTCIKPEKCPAKDDTKYPVKRVCPTNEHWETSTAHCQKNCTNMNIPLPCLTIDVVGCVCNEGLYRRKDGKCVPRNKCPKKAEHSEDDLLDQDIFNQDEMLDHDDNFDQDEMLDEDEIYNEEDAWKKTENSKEDESDEENARKEMQSEENFCPLHEEFIKCKSYDEPDCGNTTLPISEYFCVSGCRCNSGYVRGPQGLCIKKEECPSNDTTHYPVKRICPTNEYWSKTNAHCQQNCTHPKPLPCFLIPIHGCVCNLRLFRSPDGKCVLKNRCPNQEERPSADSEELINESFNKGDCPDEYKCSKYCRMHGDQRGYCNGPQKRHCKCTK